jgi:pimeloyl-ACP methyl ester carboxylesterase
MSPVFVVIIILIGLPLMGIIYEVLSSAKDRQKYPPPGKLLDVGGHRLHINCMGPENDGPAVIFEAGSGGSSTGWGLVQSEVAKFAQTCAYDRAGCGWSEPGPKPRTVHKIAEELHTLLENAEIVAPYILVGHAFGGINAQVFASMYPDDVAGIVLVEASHPSRFEGQAPDMKRELSRIRRVAVMQYIGLTRLLANKLFHEAKRLPEEQRPLYVAHSLHNSKNVVSELRPVLDNGVDIPETLGDMPLAVVSKGLVEMFDGEITPRSKNWADLQSDLASRSSDSVHITAETGGHYVHIDEPQVVIGAIKQIFDKLQNKT